MSDSDGDHQSDHGQEDINIEVIYPLNEETEVPSTNGQLFKTVLVEGTGSKPANGAKVSVHYVGTLESDGSKFDSSRDRSDPFEFTIGQGQVIKGWDKGVATMRKGEKAILKCLSDYAYGANGSPPKIPANATLLFEVELLDWSKSEDISGSKDRSLMKATIVEGKDWAKPEYESSVVADIQVLEDADGQPDESAKVLGKVDGAKIVIGDSELPPGLELLLKSMKKGEVAVAAVRSPAANAGAGAGALLADVVPTGKNFQYRATLTDFTNVKTWEVKGTAKIDEGKKRKDDGNAYFKAGQWDKAESKYKRALEFVEQDYGLETEEDKGQARTIKIAVLNNLAQVYLNRGDLRGCITQCDKSLEADPGNLKALFKRGKCHGLLDNWDDGKSDLRQVLHADPSNTDAQRELAVIDGKINAHAKKQKSLFGNMFSRMAKMEEVDNKNKPPAPPSPPKTKTEEEHDDGEDEAEEEK